MLFRAVAERVLPHFPHAGGPQIRGAAKNEKNVQKNVFKKKVPNFFFFFTSFRQIAKKTSNLRPLDKISLKNWSKKYDLRGGSGPQNRRYATDLGGRFGCVSDPCYTYFID